MYIQIQLILTAIKRRDPLFNTIDENIVYAMDSGIAKFDDYYKLMKSNDIYFIATILDP
jgi:hypothetical protein